jgi:hypothetical protein
MTIPTILGQGVLLLGLLFTALTRLRSRRHSAIQHRLSARPSVTPESPTSIPRERWPDSRALAGVPLRILLSDTSDPGGLLRDTLMIRPSSRDQ